MSTSTLGACGTGVSQFDMVPVGPAVAIGVQERDFVVCGRCCGALGVSGRGNDGEGRSQRSEAGSEWSNIGREGCICIKEVLELGAVRSGSWCKIV